MKVLETENINFEDGKLVMMETLKLGFKRAENYGLDKYWMGNFCVSSNSTRPWTTNLILFQLSLNSLVRLKKLWLKAFCPLTMFSKVFAVKL